MTDIKLGQSIGPITALNQSLPQQSRADKMHSQQPKTADGPLAKMIAQVKNAPAEKLHQHKMTALAERLQEGDYAIHYDQLSEQMLLEEIYD